jgi:GR25 family glycosyltransferase involved in LPS biosynthesis
MSHFDRFRLDNWVINLAHRTDRMAHANQQFARANLPVDRFEAFLPEEWPGPEEKVARIRARTPGAIGCYQSQTHVIRTAVGSDRIVGVFEDDVCFCEDLQDRLAYLEEHLTWDWDVLYLGATFHVPGVWYANPDCAAWHHRGRDVEPTDDPHILRVFGEWGTYAYFVNGRNARKVLDALDEMLPNSDGIDHNFIRIGDALNCYCLVPGAAWQMDNASDIGTGGFTHFSHFKKLGPYVWTERMEDFDPSTFDWEKGGDRGDQTPQPVR